MLTAAIWIDARAEADIRAVVVCDDRAGRVPEELRGRRRVFGRVPVLIAFQPDFFEAIRRIVAKIIISELLIFPRLTDVHRYPAPVCQEFRPAMVALDRAFVLIGRNGRANRKTRWNTNAARQSNKIGVEIRAVAGAHVAGAFGVTAAPAGA